MSPQLNFSSKQILEQLDRILSVQEFKNSQVLPQFLEYVVKETIEGREKELKEYNIAVNALSRKHDFNPQADAIVRIHAGRLRRALQEYYNTQGRDDTIIISMPKGSYAALFTENPGVSAPPSLPEIHIPVQEKTTVAVLPFRNIGSAANDFFAEGLGEQLSIELARYDIHRVIAYYSSRHIAAQTGSIKEVGDILRARYILTGSVQRNRNKLHVYAQLIDTETSEQLWVQSFEKKNIGKDLFEIQDEIVQSVVNKTAGYYGAIFRNTARLPPGKIDEDMKIYNSVFYYYRYKNNFTNKDFQKARRALNYAVKADPEYALAWALLGEIYGDSYIMHFDTVKDPLQQGLECARKAIKADPLCQHAYQALAWVCIIMHNKQEAMKAMEKCVAINPNDMFTVGAIGFGLICLGEFDEGIKYIEDSIQLNPFFPWWFNLGIGFYYFYKKEYEDALYWADTIQMPHVPWDAILKVPCLANMERNQEAAFHLNKMLESSPGIEKHLREYIGMFLSSDELVNELYDGFVKAGLREKKNPASRQGPQGVAV